MGVPGTYFLSDSYVLAVECLAVIWHSERRYLFGLDFGHRPAFNRCKFLMDNATYQAVGRKAVIRGRRLCKNQGRKAFLPLRSEPKKFGRCQRVDTAPTFALHYP